uniref:Uncharacterized protein n=1 Tax=Caenorhabditis japonica TaxID=281687 RepID=A0A8R1DKR9_CAEJA
MEIVVTGEQLRRWILYDMDWFLPWEDSISYQRTLQNSIVQFFRNRRNTRLFQQDNPWLGSRKTDQNSPSPDLNPVQHLWGRLARREAFHPGRAVRNCPIPVRTTGNRCPSALPGLRF